MPRRFAFIFCTLFLAACQAKNIYEPTPNIEISTVEIKSTVITAIATATSTAHPTTTLPPTATRIPEPTLILPIDPTRIPGMLQASLSIEALSSFNNHNRRRITGWVNGFNNNNYGGYQWMDTNHLLLFPVVGESQSPNWRTTLARAAVINLDTGGLWLPPVDYPKSQSRVLGFSLPRWSPKLGVLITTEKTGEGDTAKESVITYKPDGTLVARYDGKLTAISPSNTKILIEDDLWVDLASGKTVDFQWGAGATAEKWVPIWSPDENQVYECCYFYGNAKTGKSYTVSDESTVLEGHPDNNAQSLHHSHGIWLNDSYVIAQFDGFYTYRDGPIPVFDISARTFRNLGALANLPDEFNNFPYTNIYVSPDKDYMWLSPGAQSETNPQVYLVNLKTLKSQLYHVSAIAWSTDGKYALIGPQVLTLSNKQLRPLPSLPDASQSFYGMGYAWHPTRGILASVSADKQQNWFLTLLDVETLSYRHLALPSNFDGIYGNSTRIVWSPDGDRLALVAADGSLWQMDYQKLESRLEQLTPPMPGLVPVYPGGKAPRVRNVSWSPDGTSLAFIGGTDIYIVDARVKP
jgi:WD40 repeat protein